jgi:hypothetical protein
MFDNGQVASPPEQFTSAKTTTAIPIRHPAIWDALLQLSLDPAVFLIDYVAWATVESEQVDLDAIVVQGEGGRFLLDVAPARRIRDLENEGLALLGLRELNLPTRILTSEDLRREPRFSNSRLVWLCSRHHVSPDLRMRILNLLSSRRSMKMGQLLQEIQGDSGGSRAVMALACNDLIEIDLVSQPLGPTTIVRSRIAPLDRVEPLIPSKKKT